ncbi:hypothetical protein Nmel_000950, partial [Mimus melanotis]
SAQKSSSWPGKGDKEKLDPCLNIQDLVPSGLLVQGHSANMKSSWSMGAVVKDTHSEFTSLG